jgi:hypothetical protein
LIRKGFLLLLAVLPVSAAAQTFQTTWPSAFNFFNILDRLNSEAWVLPDCGQTYGSQTLKHWLGITAGLATVAMMVALRLRMLSADPEKIHRMSRQSG